MICRDRKLIFVHIPKAGGSSVEDMLWPEPRVESDLWHGVNPYQTGGLQHLTAQQIRQEVGDALFESCYVFALVRDPVDRLVSQFNYLNQRADLLRRLSLGAGRDFSTYLRHIALVEHVQWAPQRHFLTDAAGAIVPEVFRLEEMGDNFARLAARTGMAGARLLHANKSLPRVVPDDWVTLTRNDIERADLEQIFEMYREDFELLGYPMQA
ncbi:sulfotransferase family 2 domain-containing protein [Roseobacteraceae bacterium S113]